MKRFAWLAILLLTPALALARPGGGEGYGGGGGDGGGDGAGDLIFLLLRLWIEFVIHYPAIGIPMTIVGILAFLAWKRSRAKAGSQNWDLMPKPVAAPPTRPRSMDLDAIRQLDPQFSAVLFEDFAYALYARAHQARTDRRALDALAPYLSAPVRDHLQQRPPQGVPVTSAVVGAMRVIHLAFPQGWIQLGLELESNLTVGEGGQYVRERWNLVRSATAQSKPPDQV
ncbi:MAG TPA: hypothetical protein VFR31_18180, partial [Thermoanaerobaculia bacterium]|nr:hypothetical protein [Thermoanaerobaculia bacterium]